LILLLIVSLLYILEEDVEVSITRAHIEIKQQQQQQQNNNNNNNNTQ